MLDAREDNGDEKLNECYLGVLYEVVRGSPQNYGWRRPTWTRELLVETMVRQTGIRIAVTTMSKALALVQARRGRPRPRVRCPWSKAAQTRRLNQIRTLLQTLPHGHVGVYEDEVDVHLNPKIGLDWMGLGQQKEVMTPGKNQKRYLAGAWDVRTQRVVWVEAERKTSDLFRSVFATLLILAQVRQIVPRRNSRTQLTPAAIFSVADLEQLNFRKAIRPARGGGQYRRGFTNGPGFA